MVNPRKEPKTNYHNLGWGLNVNNATPYLKTVPSMKLAISLVYQIGK